jgi:hypothetical protein
MQMIALTLLIGSLAVSGEATSADARRDVSDLLTLGSRVRVLAPSAVEGRVTGLLSDMDETSLLIATNATLVRVPRRAITRLQVSRARPRRFFKGALLGAAFTTSSLIGGCGGAETPCTKEVGQALLAGAIWGGLIGGLRRGDRWSDVPLTLVGVAPQRPSADTETAVPGPPTEETTTAPTPSAPPPTSWPFVAGSTVRVQAPAVFAEPAEGVVAAVDERSLSLRRKGGALLTVPREAITSLEVSTGRHGQAGRGALVGAGVGAALLGLVAFASADDGEGAYAAMYGVVFGGLGGAGWGAIAGAGTKTHDWRTVPLHRLHARLGPTRGRGLGLNVSMTF